MQPSNPKVPNNAMHFEPRLGPGRGVSTPYASWLHAVDRRAARCRHRRSVGFGAPLRLRESVLSTSNMARMAPGRHLDLDARWIDGSGIHPRAVALPLRERLKATITVARYPKTLLVTRTTPGVTLREISICTKVPLERKLHRR